jgi:hypothetical protein
LRILEFHRRCTAERLINTNSLLLSDDYGIKRNIIVKNNAFFVIVLKCCRFGGSDTSFPFWRTSSFLSHIDIYTSKGLKSAELEEDHAGPSGGRDRLGPGGPLYVFLFTG